MSEPITVTNEQGLTTVTIDRPDAMSALDREAKVALRDALAEAVTSAECRAILLASSSERAFCVGQDLNEHVGNLAGDDPLSTVHEHYNPIARLLFHTGKPTVAAVRGAAAGAGAGLAFLTDFRVGGPRTSFTLAFAGIGLAADTGASYTLPRLVGDARTRELLILNRSVKAEEAARIGLLTELTDSDDDVLPRAKALALQLAAGPTVAYEQIKRQLRNDGAAFEAALQQEVEAQDACGHTADHAAAVDAFVNKRRPEFEGR